MSEDYNIYSLYKKELKTTKFVYFSDLLSCSRIQDGIKMVVGKIGILENFTT